MEPPEGYHIINPIKDRDVFGDAWEGYKFGTRMSVDAVRAIIEGLRGGTCAPLEECAVRAAFGFSP